MKRLLLPLAVVTVGLFAISCQKEKRRDTNKERITEVPVDQDRVNYEDEDSNVVILDADGKEVKKRKNLFKFRASVKPPKVDGKTVKATSIDISNNGRYAYVSYNTEGETYLGAMDIIDVSDKNNPSIVTTLKFSETDVSAVDYDDQTDRLYMATASSDEGFDAPAILEVLPLNNHRYDSELTSTRLGLTSYVATYVKVGGNDVYVTTGDGGKFYVLNKDDLSEEKSFVLDDARSVGANSHQVGVMQGTPGRFTVYNQYDHNPAGNYQTGGANIPESKSHLWMTEYKAYLASGDEGVKVIDLITGMVEAELPNPQVEGVNPDLAVANTVTVHDYKYIIVGNGEAGVYVYEVNDLDNINVIGKLKLKMNKSVNHVTTQCNLLFVARGTAGFQIFEIQD